QRRPVRAGILRANAANTLPQFRIVFTQRNNGFFGHRRPPADEIYPPGCRTIGAGANPCYSAAVMHILFVTPNRLGDAVLSTGLLDPLVRAHPTASITVVCGPIAADLFLRMPNRAATLVMRKQPWGLHW